MNILLVTENYHPITGGTETLVRQLAHKLQAGGHQVRVAAFRFLPFNRTLPPRFVSYAAAKYIYTSFHPSYVDDSVLVASLSPNWFDRLCLLPMLCSVLPGNQLINFFTENLFGIPQYDWAIFSSIYIPKLRKLMKSVDVVHFFGGDFVGWATQSAAKEAGLPFVVTPLMHPSHWGDDPINVAYYRKAIAVIALHEAEQKSYCQLGVSPNKIHVIGAAPDLPNQVDETSFRRKFGLEQHPIILFIGRLVAYKGGKAILEAAHNVWHEFPNARFVFIGPLSEESVSWFEGADPRIIHLGKVSQQEKADALAACDIFCMPSIFESLGLVYLEAWSYKKPVIGGKATYSPALIEGNHAGLVVETTLEAVGEAILKLLNDPELRRCYGEAGYELVQAKFNLNTICDALEKLYGSLNHC